MNLNKVLKEAKKHQPDVSEPVQKAGKKSAAGGIGVLVGLAITALSEYDTLGILIAAGSFVYKNIQDTKMMKNMTQKDLSEIQRGMKGMTYEEYQKIVKAGEEE